MSLEQGIIAECQIINHFVAVRALFVLLNSQTAL
jgi:hypothetical protein